MCIVAARYVEQRANVGLEPPEDLRAMAARYNCALNTDIEDAMFVVAYLVQIGAEPT